MAHSRQYWLMKSEPTSYSIDDLKRDGVTFWSGVRNYQARNFMRDQMQVGDGVLFYHSNIEPVGIAGRAEVIRCGYPDHTAWDPKDRHYDPQSRPDQPIWVMVDIRFVGATRRVITRPRLKTLPALSEMTVLKQGSRLSVQPVRPDEWAAILELSEWD